MIVIRASLPIFVSFIVLVASGASAEPMRIDLKERSLLEPNRPLAGLSAFVEMEASQPDVTKGIEFGLTLINGTGRSVTFWHSWKSVRISLYNEQGIKVDVPTTAEDGPGKGRISPETWDLLLTYD